MGGGLLAKAQTILFETFPREEQATAQGFFGIIVIAGPAIGPTLGGWIVTNVDWRWIFFVNLPVGIAAVFACIAALPADEGERDTSRVDWLAILLLAVGLGAMQTVLEEGNSDDWFESNFIVACTVAAAVGVISFVWRELVSEVPVVDLRVLRYRSLWAGSLLSVAMGMALYGALFAVPVFAQNIMQMTPEQTGFMLLPGAMASAVGMQVISRLARKTDPRMLLTAGGLGLCAAMVWLGDLTPQTGEDDLFWPLIVRAFATVAMYLPLNLAALGPIPKRDISSASAFFNLTRQLGGSIGVALLATLVDRREAFHRAVLVEKLVPGGQAVSARLSMLAQRFSAAGDTVFEAQHKALKLLDGLVDQQASVMSFADTFWATALLLLGTMPLVLLLGKPARDVQVDAGH
jgi:DHA2 family multidrug resistance protein